MFSCSHFHRYIAVWRVVNFSAWLWWQNMRPMSPSLWWLNYIKQTVWHCWTARGWLTWHVKKMLSYIPSLLRNIDGWWRSLIASSSVIIRPVSRLAFFANSAIDFIFILLSSETRKNALFILTLTRYWHAQKAQNSTKVSDYFYWCGFLIESITSHWQKHHESF